MQTPLPEHDLVQPMEDDDGPLAADESGEDGLLMRMEVPSLHAGAKRFVFMCKGVTERVLDHCNVKGKVVVRIDRGASKRPVSNLGPTF